MTAPRVNQRPTLYVYHDITHNSMVHHHTSAFNTL